MEQRLLNAYESVFNNYSDVNIDEDLAREAIQRTIFNILLSKKTTKDELTNPVGYIIWRSKLKVREILRGKREFNWLLFENEMPMVQESHGDGGISLYQSIEQESDLGQISDAYSIIELKDVCNSLGENLGFVMDHLDFSDGYRCRGAKEVSNRPKIFDSEKDRFKMSYIRKKLRKEYENS